MVKGAPQDHHTEPGDAAETRSLRRILITAGMMLAAVILVAIAIYALAFLILAPMMQ